MMEGPGADSEEKHEPVRDIDTAVVVVVGLKALDPERPIREAIDPTRTLEPPAKVGRLWQCLRNCVSMSCL